MPRWVNDGADNYVKRLPRGASIEWVEVPVSKRTRDTADTRMLEEAIYLERYLKPQELIVALDVEGKLVSTETIAEYIAAWQSDSLNIAFVIGGPDGLHRSLKAKAIARWSLGLITLPHALVRVILAEQLYRAWSINTGHPYHRA